MSSIVEILHVGDRGKLTNLKNTGTIFFHQCPFEKMPLLYFDYVKSADFGSEKKILVKPFFMKKNCQLALWTFVATKLPQMLFLSGLGAK